MAVRTFDNDDDVSDDLSPEVRFADVVVSDDVVVTLSHHLVSDRERPRVRYHLPRLIVRPLHGNKTNCTLKGGFQLFWPELDKQ